MTVVPQTIAERLGEEKRVLEERLARIRNDLFHGASDGDAEVDTIPCPKCERKIVPQWTYTGRQYLLMVSHFAIEGHDTSRFCPLCGVDIDGYVEDLLQVLKNIDAEIEENKLTPWEKIRCRIVDGVACVVVGVVIVSVILAMVVSC